MDTKEFRAIGHELIDWMADYMDGVGDGPIVPETRPGDIRRQLPAAAPEQGEAFASIMADFKSLIVPGMTHWNHPGWFAYFPANNSPPSVLAEMLMATMGAQCMSWQTSPAATELEQVVMSWLGKMLGLPEGFTGVIQDTASTATLVALLTARERVTAHQFGQKGAQAVADKRLRIYASDQAHSSIDKAVKLAGFGLENLVRVAVDDDYALSPAALKAAIDADLQAGHHPTCVVATVGTTSSSAIDPIDEIGKICQAHQLFFHVDGAYGGSAAIVPELQGMLRGIERADSFVFNPHKWLLTNFDCSAHFVKDVDGLLHTFQSSPEYLKTKYDPEVANFRDWGIQLGRRFRALKLWFVLRSYGVEGLQKMIRGHLQMAQDFRRWMDESEGFEVLAPVPLGLVCFAYVGQFEPSAQDAFNAELMARVNASGRAYLTHTRLGGRYTLRMSIGQRTTTPERVRETFECLQKEKDRLLESKDYKIR